MHQTLHYKILTALLASACSAGAQAASSDTSERLIKLQQMVEQLQQQRLEQDKQIALLPKELVGIEYQVIHVKITRSEEKGSTKDAPVLENFKDGVSFEDGSGNWKFAINNRVQADYRHFSPDENAADILVCAALGLAARSLFIKTTWRGWKANILAVAQF